MSFTFRKDTVGSNKPNIPFKLPIGNPNELTIQPKGSMVYSPIDNFVYISDGLNWDRVSGVNNPVDLLLPVTQHRMAKWSEDYPPGSIYSSPVLQDSSLEIDDDGNAILSDTGNTPSTFPWTNANLMSQGSIVTSYTFGTSLDTSDPTSFIPVLTQLQGVSSSENDQNIGIVKTKDSYNEGSVVIGHAAMDDIISSSADPKSSRNVIVGVNSAKNFSTDATDNVCIGWSSNKGSGPLSGKGNVSIGSSSSLNSPSTMGCVSIGAFSSASSNNNVVIGYDSSDGSYNNIVSLGSHTTAKGGNRLVLGSGIDVVKISPEKIDNNGGVYITIQVGIHTYMLPLMKVIS